MTRTGKDSPIFLSLLCRSHLHLFFIFIKPITINAHSSFSLPPPLKAMVNLTLYTVKAVVMLDSDGGRVLAKYFGSDYANPKDQKAFEKGLYDKTKRAPHGKSSRPPSIKSGASLSLTRHCTMESGQTATQGDETKEQASHLGGHAHCNRGHHHSARNHVPGRSRQFNNAGWEPEMKKMLRT